MQVQPHYPRVLRATLVCSILLAIIISPAPLTWKNLASASTIDQILKTHVMPIQPIQIRYNPIPVRHVLSTSTAAQPVLLACQDNANPQPSLCYGPYQVRQAYNVNALLERGITGKGTSITIIDAYGNPYIRKDLQTFNAIWGLPNSRLNIIAPFGVDGTDNSWIAETSLDVEWAHVMAPEATINLVLARDSNDYSIYKVLSYAVAHNLSDIISLSFGENENCVDAELRREEHQLFREATRKGITLVAATGDFGSAQMACESNTFEKAISFPSDDPLVTAVGGTTLEADASSGQYVREKTWNESRAFNKATGGGYSRFYHAPAFQSGLAGTSAGRGVPDLSLNASVNGGVIVFESHSARQQHPTIDIMGGTSTAAPEMAGLFADAVQMAHHRLGMLNPALYRLGNGPGYHQLMNDIASGDNVLLSSGFAGYRAGPGWDAATGWGTPKDAGSFLKALIAATSKDTGTGPGSSKSAPPLPARPQPSLTPTPGIPISLPVEQQTPPPAVTPTNPPDQDLLTNDSKALRLTRKRTK
ncbi:MAG TPA: S8 family serine peptidase [Ktedonobacteraceae bacterium]